MKKPPFYDEYLQKVVAPKIAAVATRGNFASLEALHARFLEAHDDTGPVSYDTFKQWFSDLGLTLTREVRVTGLPSPPMRAPGPDELLPVDPLRYGPLAPSRAPTPFDPRFGGLAYQAATPMPQETSGLDPEFVRLTGDNG